MNKITINNYEAFIIDYLDGNLNEEGQNELKVFFKNNPSIEHPTDLPLITTTEKNNFTQKESIKVNYNNSFAIEYVEGNLKKDELLRAKKLEAENKIFSLEVKYLKACKIAPDKSIVFTEKELLKKNKLLFLFTYKNVLRIAAILLITLSLAVFWNYKAHNQKTIVKNTTKKYFDMASNKRYNNYNLKKLKAQGSITHKTERISNLKNQFIKKRNEKNIPQNKNTVIKIDSNNLIKLNANKLDNMIVATDTIKTNSSDKQIATNNNELSDNFKENIVAYEIEKEEMPKKDRGKLWIFLTTTIKKLNKLNVTGVNVNKNESEITLGQFSVTKN
ncbi:MAG: hypothetical protein JSU07_14250 [Bacteroidetes bacterium]|nr:hypothetical protein [Bacteroidota bacterium]